MLALSPALLIGFWTIMGPLEFIYYLGYSFKKSGSLGNRKRLPRKVISVGNLTTGGTGKTPAAIAIAEEARKRGYQPCILTRGYRGRAKGPCFVSKGGDALLGVDEAGDEASLMAEKLRDISVVKGEDRYEAGMFALQYLKSAPILFILDDGFQHWRLFRDVDILLIDSGNPFGNKRLLPSGILREPLTEIKRADIIALTKRTCSESPDKSFLIDEIRTYNPDAPMYMSEHRPIGLRTLSGEKLPLNIISGRPVFAFCGIGNPVSFRNTLSDVDAKVKGFKAFRDHHPYDRQEIQRISEAAKKCKADWIVTTEKDIIRLRDFELSENFVALLIEFKIDDGFYTEIFSAINNTEG